MSGTENPFQSSEQQTTNVHKALRWRPLPAPLDPSSSPLPIETVTVDETHCYPCRKCLQDGTIGEQMLLLSYDPFLGDSPYRHASPIFVHASPECELASLSSVAGQVPEQQRRRLLSVRAFDQDHAMVKADVIDGVKLITVSEEFLEDEKVEYVHVHYAVRGCFALRIERDKVAL